MSKRLQVVVPDEELASYEECAQASGLTLSAWVREALRGAQRRTSGRDVDMKLQAVRRAAACNFPTADIGEMLAQIERGYLVDGLH